MKPKDFLIRPMGSVLQKAEAETIARNIMAILTCTGNDWRRLSWEEYSAERLKDGCSENDLRWEYSYFNAVIDYTISPDTAKLFSPAWKNIQP